MLAAKIFTRVCKKCDQLEKFINIRYLSQDHLKTGDFRKEREGGSCSLKTENPFKTGELEHKQKGRGKWIWSICYGRQLIVFKSPGKYMNSIKTVITNIKICFTWNSSTVIICHLVVNVGMKLPEREVWQPRALLNTWKQIFRTEKNKNKNKTRR